MTSRHTSIRLRMLLLILVPLISLVLVYAYAVAGEFSTALGLANAGKVSGTTITPISDALVALNAERSSAVQYLATRSSQAGGAFRQDEAATDRAFGVVKDITKSGPVTANASQLDKTMAARFVRDDDGALQTLRSEVASGSVGRTAAINAYSAIMLDGLRVAEQSLQMTLVSQSLATTARQEVNLYAAMMLALEENDIYSGDMLARQMPAADQKEFAQLAGLRQYLVNDAVPQLDAEAGGLLHREVPASLSAALDSQENAIIAAPAGTATPAVPLTVWQHTVQTYASHLEVVLTKSPNWIQAQVTSSARRSLTTFIVAASLGLLAVIASIVFSLLMGRRLMRRLNGLRQSALELAHDRLPQVMTRLRDGETVDLDAEAPPVQASVDEIDQVRQAFNTVHRTAVTAAIDETNLRRGINQVFRNLAMRSQVLLHRQLGLLDAMERRAEEPDQLEDLFRIDHLTTRMRRHAEGLIVLAGDSPARGWRQPVTFIDVLRAAVAEVEDYTRVKVEVRTKAALAGPAVSDVVHMLAELIENAAVYSPPNTMVRVQGELVGRGFCVEVEDRGLGMAEDQQAELNNKLASVPTFDPSGSDRLGLFVAGRLAHRHGISVSLRSSVYGGTTAVVIIPTNLVITNEGQVPAVATSRYALRDGAAVPALSVADGPGSNGHAYNGNGRSDHLGNGHGSDGRGGSDLAGSLTDLESHPAGAETGHVSTQAEPELRAADDSGWWTRPAPDGSRVADSIQAGQAIGGATEIVPASTANPAPPIAENGELPVRVRQASLAPQLRERTGAGGDYEAGGEPREANGGTYQAATPTSAEAARTTMSAMQRGWELGRSVAAESPDEPASDDLHHPRHRAHPEEA
jgi:signal transduction histidine kinase